jgi:hypothetical protein
MKDFDDIKMHVTTIKEKAVELILNALIIQSLGHILGVAVWYVNLYGYC